MTPVESIKGRAKAGAVPKQDQAGINFVWVLSGKPDMIKAHACHAKEDGSPVTYAICGRHCGDAKPGSNALRCRMCSRLVQKAIRTCQQ